ncbi:DUF4160 domain-containing protein [Marinobacter salarius]
MSLEKELRTLQNRLAEVDMHTTPSRRTHSGFTELLLLKLQNLKLKMYQEKGHELPHVHVDYGKQHHVASFSISPPGRLDGTMAKKYERVILGWIDENIDKLLEIWAQLQSGADPKELLPQLKANA